jgi:hypothetical protein
VIAIRPPAIENRDASYRKNSHQGFSDLPLIGQAERLTWTERVSTGVVGAMISTSVSGKVIAMWMPIMVFFGMTFEHSVVNMFLFPSALIMGGNFSVMD